MRIVKGNVFKMGADAVAITTNGMVRKDGSAVMGAGIAKSATALYPGVEVRLGELLAAEGNQVYWINAPSLAATSCVPLENVTESVLELPEQPALLAFPTKQHWRDPSSLDLIAKSAFETVELADAWGWETIALPQPGCGLGGLKWEGQVRPLLEPIFDDRFLVSTGI